MSKPLPSQISVSGPTRSLTSWATKILRRAILAGYFEPGERLDQDKGDRLEAEVRRLRGHTRRGQLVCGESRLVAPDQVGGVQGVLREALRCSAEGDRASVGAGLLAPLEVTTDYQDGHAYADDDEDVGQEGGLRPEPNRERKDQVVDPQGPDQPAH